MSKESKAYAITVGALCFGLASAGACCLSLAHQQAMLRVRVDMLELQVKSMEAGLEAVRAEAKMTPTVERK